MACCLILWLHHRRIQFPQPPRRGTLREHEAALILQTLRDAGGIIGGPRGAAARLGLKRTTLVSKMKRLGIYRPRHQRRMNELNEESELTEPIATDLVPRLENLGE